MRVTKKRKKRKRMNRKAFFPTSMSESKKFKGRKAN
jgi:hypothetical protein